MAGELRREWLSGRGLLRRSRRILVVAFDAGGTNFVGFGVITSSSTAGLRENMFILSRKRLQAIPTYQAVYFMWDVNT
jgi:hypothetical protein